MKQNANFFRSVLGSLCLILMGVILLTNPDFGSVLVSNIIGWALVILGGLALVYGILNRWLVGIGWLAASTGAVLAGALILWKPLLLAKLLGILLGLYLVYQGAGALRGAIRLKRALHGYTASLVLALLLLLFGVVLMFLPLTTSRVLMTLAGLGMLVCGIVNLAVHAKTDKEFRDDGPDIVDADP